MLEPVFDPFPEIDTQRLLLRCINIADAPEILFLRSDENVMKYIDREKMKSLEETKTWIEMVLNNLNEKNGIMWAICLKNAPQKLIGTIGHWRLIKQHYRAEVGYMLHPDHWGNGIMKEALQAVVEYGFKGMNLHSIEAHINPENIASGRLLEKCGFVREAYFKEDYFFRGQFGDTAIYSILNS